MLEPVMPLHCSPLFLHRRLPVVLPLLTALLGTAAHAQTLQVSLAATYGTDGHPALSPGVTVLNAAIVAGVGVNARLTADLGPRSALDLALLAVLPVGPASSEWNVYAGPGASLQFGRPVLLRPGFTAGVSDELNGQTQLFLELSSVWQGSLLARAGFTYSF